MNPIKLVPTSHGAHTVHRVRTYVHLPISGGFTPGGSAILARHYGALQCARSSLAVGSSASGCIASGLSAPTGGGFHVLMNYPTTQVWSHHVGKKGLACCWPFQGHSGRSQALLLLLAPSPIRAARAARAAPPTAHPHCKSCTLAHAHQNRYVSFFSFAFFMWAPMSSSRLAPIKPTPAPPSSPSPRTHTPAFCSSLFHLHIRFVALTTPTASRQSPSSRLPVLAALRLDITSRLVDVSASQFPHTTLCAGFRSVA